MGVFLCHGLHELNNGYFPVPALIGLDYGRGNSAVPHDPRLYGRDALTRGGGGNIYHPASRLLYR
jgi:hypothetical protein